MIGQGLGRLALAEKLSIGQLQDAIKNKTIPAYIGIPLLEEKMMMEKRMSMPPAPQQQPPIAQQVMAQANQMEGGIDELPVPEPEFAGGGIVAFEDGGQVQRFQNQGLVENDPMLEKAIQMMLRRDPSFNADYLRRAISTAPPEMRDRLLAQLRDSETQKFLRQGEGVPGAMPNSPGIPRADIERETAKFMRQGQGVPSVQDNGIAPPNEDLTQPEKMPSANLGQINMTDLVGRSTQLADALGFKPSEGKIPTIQEASKTTSDLLKESGYDEGVLGRIGEDIKSQREALAKDRQEAKAYRIIEAGLGIMGGTSANAFENISKGGIPALKGLASDIKDLQKAEREFKLAEQNVLLKQNEAAMGKARITQATIDKAQEAADKKAENYNRLRGDLAKTMLSGEIQKEIAKASYGSRMTDFERKWSLAEAEAKRQKVPLTPQFFAQMWSVGAGAMTREEAVNKILSTDYGKQLDLSNPEDRKKLNEQVEYLLSVGSPRATPSASGKAPPPPPGFITQ